MKLLDCTLRDGGYYNSWDFSIPLIQGYLGAMQAAGVDVVELGFRSLTNTGFKGACAYTTDAFLNSLNLPEHMNIAVMINGNELVGELSVSEVIERLFPVSSNESPVSLVRIACHAHEFSQALPATECLKRKGYLVGFNLMQVADRTEQELKELACLAAEYPIDVLYFADSMGGMSPDQVAQIIGWLRNEWSGALGIHTHDNMGLALSNTLRALSEGVSWVDSTVTGMGRGPGNALTEELAVEMAERRGKTINLVPLMALIHAHFKPMQVRCGWGKNIYYYLAGKYGIHPTYIQEMLSDSRFSEEDVLAVIEYLREEGGKKFSLNTLDAARHFYHGSPKGRWMPVAKFAGRDVLILGTGPGVAQHRAALEHYIHIYQPLVLALNTQSAISAELIDLRVACHPVRLLADCELHKELPQPLITPYSMLPENVQESLKDKSILDFGLNVQASAFRFSEKYCTLPVSMVIAYALAIATSGQASRILMAGFDGYGADDPRNIEMDRLLDLYRSSAGAREVLAITPTRYRLDTTSVYAL
ncbi:aldolase catalytic domain-containing protein [Pseudomonas lopnurensis]|uniref:aldolase catalytic domain-containing protein n=1 Tax=Pseudomonas lopnurensis TaxID=1477517 RepID=UPI0028A6A2F8|nr:aldolase catalytic domain-containing protein [Pseudomonas lopnurensis]